ncbi:class I mannose-6-phosphate isomerase [Amnibacterium endophyticum]|uniref:Class I mannose-6-phosphate isomerase n=1 Tax=Amnibacterium endophyticum TaxID=2109337 RepID=A0ABW4LHW0_9MICO
MTAPREPVLLPSNRPADRFYRGGRRITDLRGDDPAAEHEPEDWVASTTHVFGRPGLGETVLPDGRRLVEAIAADPVGWLGETHAARWGADAMLLTKLLDAGQRLPVHAHPDGAFAQQHLGHVHGKTEAWVVLTAGTVHLGLREDVAPERLRALVDDQRTTELLELLHAVEVRPGDAVLVPAGQLHAIGEGVLLLEVQEPEDLSILLEWSGFALDGAADGHLGLGFDRALGAVAHEAMSRQRLAGLVVRGRSDGPVLPEEAAPFFRVERLRPAGTGPRIGGYCVLLVEEGPIVLGGHALARGATAVLPAAAGELPVEGDGVLLVCRPPDPSA